MAMHESCLPIVPEDRYFKIHKWAIDACDGDHCAAAIIAVMEFHHNGILAYKGLHGAIGFSYPRSMQQWEDDLFNLYKRDRIRESLKKLSTMAFITISEHPERWNRGDRRQWYELQVDAVRDWMYANISKLSSDGNTHERKIVSEQNSHVRKIDNEQNRDDSEHINLEAIVFGDNALPNGGDHQREIADHERKNVDVYNEVLTNLNQERHTQSLTPIAVPEPEPEKPRVCDSGDAPRSNVIPFPNGTYPTDPKPSDPMALAFDTDNKRTLAIECLGMLDAVRKNVLREPSTYAVSRFIDPKFADVVHAYGQETFRDICKYLCHAKGTKIREGDGTVKEDYARNVLTPSHLATKFEEYRVAAEAWKVHANRPRQRRVVT